MTTEAPDVLRQEEFFEFIAMPDKRADPYPFYDRVRSLAPAFNVEMVWLLSSYDYVAQVLRDPRFSTDERKSNVADGSTGEFYETPFGRLYFNMLLFVDDPDHKRLRDLVQKGFTRKTVEDLRPRIQRLVDELVDGLIEHGGGSRRAPRRSSRALHEAHRANARAGLCPSHAGEPPTRRPKRIRPGRPGATARQIAARHPRRAPRPAPRVQRHVRRVPPPSPRAPRLEHRATPGARRGGSPSQRGAPRPSGREPTT